MPIFSWTDETPEGVERRKKIEAIMPKEPIVSRIIDLNVLNKNRKKLIQMLKAEIEVYRAWPNKHRYEPKIFNPRNSRQCFMGQAFQSNGKGFEGWYDKELVDYRKAVGTIPHETWGECTLLEIWGGDHFEKYPKMVTNVFNYCHGALETMPRVNFYINPFYKNGESGTWEPDPDEIERAKERLHYVKLGHYIEIRNALKKAKVKNVMQLSLEDTITEDDLKYIMERSK